MPAPKDYPDFDLFLAFITAAEELNFSRAAARLCISQPPLTRKIRRLETLLGKRLFYRHAGGVSLTSDGHEALRIIKPMMETAQQCWHDLEKLKEKDTRELRIGFTTACDQEVFWPLEERLRSEWGTGLKITRKSSPRLEDDVRAGKLSAAFVALPVNDKTLAVHPLDYRERLLAVLPAAWPEAARSRISLRDLNSRPLFWFNPSRNMAWHAHMRSVFANLEFCPVMIDEPMEHEVLLARIAQGEAMGLLPESLARICRPGIKFVEIAASSLLTLEFGLIATRDTDANWLMELFYHTCGSHGPQKIRHNETGILSKSVREKTEPTGLFLH